MNTLLDVRHLSVSFESYDAKLQKVIFTAVKDMSLTLEKGKIPGKVSLPMRSLGFSLIMQKQAAPSITKEKNLQRRR